jgi:hypothetical protein
MAWRTGFELVVFCAGGLAVFPSAKVLAQQVVVDATPSHVVNSFSPMRSLGAGVDRLRAGEGAPEMDRRRITKEEVEQNTDKLLSGPILKAILGAGWQPVTYRQTQSCRLRHRTGTHAVPGAIRNTTWATSRALRSRGEWRAGIPRPPGMLASIGSAWECCRSYPILALIAQG